MFSRVAQTNSTQTEPAGAVCVQMLKPQFCKTFLEYSEKVFLPYITKSLENVQRVDLVWDEYIPNSLKACTREKRGTGARRRDLPSVTVPRNWQDFLRSDDNKKELFTFLSEQAMTIVIESKQIVATHGTKVLCSPPMTVGKNLSPCSHEEADTTCSGDKNMKRSQVNHDSNS